MDVDGNVSGQKNVPNIGQMGRSYGTGMSVEQSSDDRMQRDAYGSTPNTELTQRQAFKGDGRDDRIEISSNRPCSGGNEVSDDQLLHIYDKPKAQEQLYEYFKSANASEFDFDSLCYNSDNFDSLPFNNCRFIRLRYNSDNFKEFDFKRFAEVNGITVEEQYLPHSNIVKGSFQRMYNVVDTLLSKGLTFQKGDDDSIKIKLTPEDVKDAVAHAHKYRSDNKEEKAYKLYNELVNVILSKMNAVVQGQYFAKNRDALWSCLLSNRYLCKSILSLPLVNFDQGMELCKRMLESTLTDAYSIFSLSEQELTDKERGSANHQALVKAFKGLGVFFAFKNDELARKILPSAQYAVSIGMKLPLFMAEITTSDESSIAGFSDDIVGVAISDDVMSSENFKEFPFAKQTFYHEITHHARSAAGARYADKSINDKKLDDILGSRDIIESIIRQIRLYALTDCEEYIAEFSARVLCCLEQNKNPFEVITDLRLWRLYYELGGPDFAPIIKKKGFLPDGYDKDCDWCSGYPSKFNIDIGSISDDIDIDSISDYTVSVVDISSPIGYRRVHITNETILPPPPIGYCYTTERGSIQLKRDGKHQPPDDKCYTPKFCSLTNGPLSFVRATDFSDIENPVLLQHHFELLKNMSKSKIVRPTTTASKMSKDKNTQMVAICSMMAMVPIVAFSVFFTLWVQILVQKVST